MVCEFLIEGDTFTSYVTKREYKINFRFNCDSKYVIYLVSCTCCGVHYVGSTITKFRVRFNNRKSKIRRHCRLAEEEKTRDDLIYRHFNGTGHLRLDRVKLQIINGCASEERLREREAQWAYKIKSIAPQGLDVEDFTSM